MDKFQEALKEFMKAELEKTVSSSLDKHSEKLSQQVTNAIKKITEGMWIWDEKKFSDIEQATKQGATYMAVRSLIDKVANDAIQSAIPKIEGFLSELQKRIIEATEQAIRELIHEELDKRQGKSKQS